MYMAEPSVYDSQPTVYGEIIAVLHNFIEIFLPYCHGFDLLNWLVEELRTFAMET